MVQLHSAADASKPAVSAVFEHRITSRCLGNFVLPTQPLQTLICGENSKPWSLQTMTMR